MNLCLLLALAQIPVALPNDNRIPAGARRGDTLVLALDIRMARWYPESDSGPSVVVPAFAPQGQAPQIPGPLIRVTKGTPLDVTVRNALADSTITLHGLITHPGPDDSVRLAPGESRRLRFAAGAPGTYLYWATTGNRYVTLPGGRPDSLEQETLAGAFVVDSTGVAGAAGAAGAAAHDRVFVINLWGEPRESTAVSPEIRRSALTINGKAWPFTERVTYALGDSVRWRWINASLRNHPMHLHGFYFRVDAKGTGLRDSTVPPPQRRLSVTEEFRPRETAAIVWVPNRPGNWLFHCHITFHVVPPAAQLDTTAHGRHDSDHMAGLVLGMHVSPGSWKEPPRRRVRKLSLTISELAPGKHSRTIGVAIGRPGARPRPHSPGPTLVLTRGQPTDITVHNRLGEAAAIHWHGLELESFSDGVAGWSGRDANLAPPIAAGDSFVARLTQPRAGTFIYHTHIHDIDQITAGLYGPILVFEPGQELDLARDHVFVVGWDGPQLRPARFLLNGEAAPAPMVLAADVRHRLRFINIGPAQRLRFSLSGDAGPARWRPVGQDGATLPPARAVAGPAAFVLPVGATYDVEFTPRAGNYRLAIAVPLPGSPPLLSQVLVVR
jgi:FtsP/CotA-like multicopper oxidase with cupredoxin domain